MNKQPYRWATAGDINAFFGLMLDNMAGLLMTVGLLASIFKFPATFAIRAMIPGTAIGVLVGDLLFFAMAIRLARRTGRADVTAMPLGLDTPSTIGTVLFVLGPAFVAAKTQFGLTPEQAAVYTWHIGICALVLTGLFKVGCAFGAQLIRRVVPRAGLLGSLSAIALVLISFLPLLDILHQPIVGMISLAIILTTLIAKVELPWRIPGALGALIVAGTVFYAMQWTGLIAREAPPFDPATGLLPNDWLAVFYFDWCAAMGATIRYLPIIIPFALATVVGGIDCTESAAAAGDEYDTRWIIGVEGIATLAAAVCGGVIQTTPYIGHPAYKAMGGRSAYTLATALFIGSAGLLGYFGYMYLIIPKAAIFTILIFIGLEITAQSYHATPTRHYAALALACVPAMAKLVMMFVTNVLSQCDKSLTELSLSLQAQLHVIQSLSSGFIVTSLLWASALAALIDRQLRQAGSYFAVAGLCTLLGIIHSPFADERLVITWILPQNLLSSNGQVDQPAFAWAIAYGCVACLLFAWDGLRKPDTR